MRVGKQGIGLKMENVNTFTVTDARENFADVVTSVAYSRQPAVITKNGRKAVAVVPYDVLELFTKIEALIDIGKANAALEDYNKNGGLTLDELKKELETE
ncbi:MAG: type II toxin-antitoxin system Phd/YefM family antitoxin [Rhodomicrobium sp.]|jgi:prevent-host-death family protein